MPLSTRLHHMATICLLIFTVFSFVFVSCKKDEDKTVNTDNNGGGSCVGGPSTVTDVEGNIYNVVTIGNQCWMKQNLKTSKYRNGSSIPGNLSDATWTSTTSGAQADYNNDPANTDIHGKLYNWYTVADPAGLCPTGWHVPSDSEWTTLENFLGGSPSAGGMLKSIGTLQSGTGLWETPNTDATNLSGFKGFPGGYRNDAGSYRDIGYFGLLWSSTQSQLLNTAAWARQLSSGGGEILLIGDSKKFGYSVRCVWD